MAKSAVSERPKLQVAYRAVTELVPFARNARTHSDEQISQLMGSVREWGFTNPVLIDEEGGIIAGHGRVLAAQRLGMGEVPTITLSGLTPTQKRAYVLADNRIALNAGWDAEMLSVELQALVDDQFDATQLGFAQTEIDNILSAFQASDAAAQGEEDDAPWDGMPEFGTEPHSFKRLIVHFASAADVADFERLIGQKIGETAKYIWHPQQVREDIKSQSWVDDDEEDHR